MPNDVSKSVYSWDIRCCRASPTYPYERLQSPIPFLRTFLSPSRFPPSPDTPHWEDLTIVMVVLTTLVKCNDVISFSLCTFKLPATMEYYRGNSIYCILYFTYGYWRKWWEEEWRRGREAEKGLRRYSERLIVCVSSADSCDFSFKRQE